MRNIYSIFVLLLSSFLFSQNYVLDTSFGNQGTLATTSYKLNSFNNNLYEFSDRYIQKLNSYGEIDVTFAENGSFFIPQNSHSNVGTSGFLKDGNVMYSFGGEFDGWTYFEFGYILKFGDNGDIDETFGDNGKLVLDFEDSYNISSLIKYNNNLYAVGNMKLANTYEDVNAIVKFDENGNIDFDFAESGYKIFSEPIYDFELITVNQELLTLVINKENGESTVSIRRLLDNGEFDMSYGDNGMILLHTFGENSYTEIERFRIIDNELFYLIKHNTSEGRYSNINKFNFENGENENLNTANAESYISKSCYFDLEGTFYLTDFYYSSNQYADVIEITRYLSNGELDSSFGINGNLTYDDGEDNSYAVPRYLFLIDDAIFGIVRFSNSGRHIFKLIPETLGTTEIENQQNIQVYPNPTTEILYVKHFEKIKSAQIFNMSGKIIKSIQSDSETLEINTKDLIPGEYIVVIDDIHGGSFSKKIIKK